MKVRDKQRWYDRWVCAWYVLRGHTVIANAKIVTTGLNVSPMKDKGKCYSLNVETIMLVDGGGRVANAGMN